MNKPSDRPSDRIVTWSDVHRDTRALVKKLPQRESWTGIVAIARGGLVPAAIVAREMNIRTIDVLCVALYEDRIKETPRVLMSPDAAIATRGKGWLVIDDLVDTGETLKIARELLPEAHFATVYGKPAGIPMVDTCIHRVEQTCWIVFPWDIPADDN
jgi:xanthine phosphoribosyltransferase